MNLNEIGRPYDSIETYKEVITHGLVKKSCPPDCVAELISKYEREIQALFQCRCMPITLIFWLYLEWRANGGEHRGEKSW